MKKRLLMITKRFYYWLLKLDNKDDRTHTVTQKVKTAFGSMYIHIHYNNENIPCGAWISDPGKEPNSQISILVTDIAIGLHHLLKENQ